MALTSRRADGAYIKKMRVPDTQIWIYPPTPGKKYHQIAYYLDGVRHTTSAGKTAKEAQAKASRIAAIVGTDAVKSLNTVSQMWSEWTSPNTARARVWGSKHQAAMEWIGKRHIDPTIGSLVCADLRRSDLQRCVDHAPTAQEGKRLRTALNTCLKWGFQESYLVKPVEQLLGGVHWVGTTRANLSRGQLSAPNVSEQGADPLWVPPDAIPGAEEVAELAYQMKELVGATVGALYVFAAAYSGMRQGELFALRAAKVDTANRRIRIDQQRVEAGGKVQVTAPKNRKNRTTIYPRRTPKTKRFPKGFDLAGEMARQQKKVQGIRGSQALMFPAPGGDMWNPSNFLSRRFHPAAAAARWPTKKVWRARGSNAPVQTDTLAWTWHSLRHVFCSYYLWDLKAKPVDVSQAVGHSSVEITLKVYASDAPGALERLGKLA